MTNTIWFQAYVESNEQTELTGKMGTGWQLVEGGEEGSNQKETGLMNMDNSVVIARGRWYKGIKR